MFSKVDYNRIFSPLSFFIFVLLTDSFAIAKPTVLIITECAAVCQLLLWPQLQFSAILKRILSPCHQIPN